MCNKRLHRHNSRGNYETSQTLTSPARIATLQISKKVHLPLKRVLSSLAPPAQHITVRIMHVNFRDLSVIKRRNHSHNRFAQHPRPIQTLGKKEERERKRRRRRKSIKRSARDSARLKATLAVLPYLNLFFFSLIPR